MTTASTICILAIAWVTPVSAQSAVASDQSHLEFGLSFNYLLIGGSPLDELHSGPGAELLIGYNFSPTFGVDTRMALTSHEQKLFVIGEDPGREPLLRLGIEPRIRSHAEGGESTGFLAGRVGYVAPSAVTDAGFELGGGIGLGFALTPAFAIEVSAIGSAVHVRSERRFGPTTRWSRIVSLAIGIRKTDRP
jgi:hypothetical protein